VESAEGNGMAVAGSAPALALGSSLFIAVVRTEWNVKECTTNKLFFLPCFAVFQRLLFFVFNTYGDLTIKNMVVTITHMVVQSTDVRV
jgi:hypothetical protein